MKFKILLVLIMSSLSICAQEEWTTHKKYNFKIECPKSWVFSDTESSGSAFVILSPIEKNETFRENINLNVSLLKGDNISLEAYKKLSLNKIHNMLPDVKILEDNTISNGIINYQVIVWTGKIGGMFLKVKQHLYVKDNKAYSLSFNATNASFERFKKTSDKILNSFSID
ncbi:PsbP-related protein [uncultured Polaribacter sp.]|uniref:PsbP-related protein n=1 Tax=uncultured Polaribacter sp. TaxID=174711 RepID=UPI0026133573|nr:PsbP-related protein [uncultured Polaribacter sp.]